MVTSVLNTAKRHMGKALLGASLLASSFANAQGPKPGLTYIGSCLDVYNQAHYYYVSTAEATWPAANSAAVAAGGYLATLTTAAENTCVFNNYVAYLTAPGGLGRPTFADSYADARNPWIGLNDATNENTFTWANGENCNNYRNWDCGFTGTGAQTCEPNNVFTPGNSNGEDYVQLLAFTPAGGDPTPGFNGEYGKKNAGAWNDWFNTESQLYLVEFGPNTCVPPPPPPTGDEGCSPGYWKNHPQSWQAYTTNQTLESVFDVPDALGYDATTLMQALNFGGGNGVQGGARILLRQAVAALLNSAHNNVDYPLTTSQVISQVNAALASMDRNTMTTLAGTLDGYNNLHGTTLCGNDVSSSTLREPGTGLGLSLDNAFAVSGYPNPTRSSFSIQVAGSSTESVTVKVTDMTGRLIEQRTNVPANQVLQIGSTYRAGMYYVEVAQGGMKKQLKMVKQ